MGEPEFDQEFYAQIGITLDAIQLTESVIMETMHLALRNKKISSTEEFENIEAVLKKLTLGQLLKKLRTDVKLNPDFEDFTKSFLDDRNEFIHSAFRLHDVNTPDGKEALLQLSSRLFRNSQMLTEIFAAVLVDFGDQLGFTLPENPEAVNYIATLRKNFIPLAIGMFEGYKEIL